MRRLAGRVAAAVILAAAVAAGLLAALGDAGVQHGRVQKVPSPVVHLRAGEPARVAIVVMENQDYGSIIGSRATPFIGALARRHALAVSMYATSHPSLPNYLALTGGSTFGISSDCTDCPIRARNLIDQLQAAGITWKAYMEGLPHPCFRGAFAGGYAKKHDPFMYYVDVSREPARCRRVVPLSQLYTDERTGRLPRLIWITPNLCHAMHDCPPAAGDRFLRRLLPPLLRRLGQPDDSGAAHQGEAGSRAGGKPGGLLVLTWDEGSTDDGCCRLASGGHIATLLAGADARAGTRMSRPVDQYSILQTVEDLLGLPRLRGAACACTPSLAPLLRRR